MAKITETVMGIKVSVDDDIFTDWDFAHDLADLKDIFDGNSTDDTVESIRLIDRIVDQMFGKKQFDHVKAQLRKANGGRLPMSVVGDFIGEAIKVFTPKNS